MSRKTAAQMTRAELLALIAAHVNGRPGFDWHNYGDAASYRADMRTAARQKNDALAMLAAIGWRDSIDADAIRKALQSGGRLTLSDDGRLEYCTGQYYPTEFRAGACRVLSSLLWDYWRENMPPPSNDDDVSRGVASPRYKYRGRTMCAGDYLRRKAREELGAGLASRWFR